MGAQISQDQDDNSNNKEINKLTTEKTTESPDIIIGTDKTSSENINDVEINSVTKQLNEIELEKEQNNKKENENINENLSNVNKITNESINTSNENKNEKIKNDINSSDLEKKENEKIGVNIEKEMKEESKKLENKDERNKNNQTILKLDTQSIENGFQCSSFSNSSTYSPSVYEYKNSLTIPSHNSPLKLSGRKILTDNQMKNINQICQKEQYLINHEIWEKVLKNEKYQIPKNRQESFDLEYEMLNLSSEIVQNNCSTKNFTTLVLYLISELKAIRISQYKNEIKIEIRNALFLVRLFTKYLIENLTSSKIQEIFELNLIQNNNEMDEEIKNKKKSLVY